MDRRQFLQASVLSTGSPLLAAAQPVAAAQAKPGDEPHLPDLTPAEWIWYPSGRCLANTFVLFRRTLELPAKPVRAAGWISAESRYLLEVNGQRVQWGPAPSDPRWAEADPLDLTALLNAGGNAIGSTVLFYGHGDGTWPIGKPGFLFWLELEFADGSKQKIVSDPTWQALLCRAWKPGQYKRWFLRALQEEFDARAYPYGWTAAGFRPDSGWLAAMPLGGSPNQPALMTKYYEYATGVRTGPAASALRPRSIPMLREVHVPVTRLAESMWIQWKRPAIEYFECRTPDAFDVDRTPVAPSGTGTEWRVALDGSRAAALTFELTEQIVGFPYFTIDAPAGTIVELMPHEAHQVGGPALLNTHFDAWTRFVCRGGTNHFECFDYESLRWIQLHIREAHGAATIRDVGVRRRLYPWPNDPVIRTSEAPLERLFTASVNTLHNSALDIIVDGMGRERQQYSGDCGHQLHGIHLAFGEHRSPARFLNTFSQGITGDGYFLDCWPAYDRLARVAQRELDLFHFGAILDHGVQLNFDSWHYYNYTGDLTALREVYPRLLRFAAFLKTMAGRDGDDLLPVEDLGIPCVWMDYQAYQQGSGVSPAFTQRHKKCSFNLYTAAMLRHALAPLCRAFGDDARARAMEAFSHSLIEPAVKRFWSAEHRTFVNNLPWLAEEKKLSMCDRSLANAVLFDQCPGGDTTAAVRALADRPKEMGISYPANAGWRLWALAKAGRTDIVLKELRERWATMESVKLNNTLQEAWKAGPDSTSQWSHCALAPLYITYQGLAGIRSLAPGFRRAEIRPQLAGLNSLELTAHTVLGPLEFKARGEIGAREISLVLPKGCDGELVVPDAERLSLARTGGPVPAGCTRYRLPAGASTIKLRTI